MAALRYTSRVFVAGRALHQQLVDATFPPHPVTNVLPSVRFGDVDADLGAEVVAVRANFDEQGTSEWARVGPGGRDEELFFDIVIRSRGPAVNVDPLDIWTRLEELCTVVEDIMYDRVTLRPREIGFPGEVLNHRSRTPQPDVFSTPDGWAGVCVIPLSLITRI